MTIFTKTITFKICHEMYYYLHVCNFGRLLFRLLIPILLFYFRQKVRPIKMSPDNFRPSNPRDLDIGPGPAQERLRGLRPLGLAAGPSQQPIGIIDISDDSTPPSPRYKTLEAKVRNELSLYYNVIVICW